MDLPDVAGSVHGPLSQPARSRRRRAHAGARVARGGGGARVNPLAAFLVGVAYLLGSVSFAVLLVRRATGQDIRTEGSGNAGATNVLRAHGKGLALGVAA